MLGFLDAMILYHQVLSANCQRSL
uniref:Uncharacterized protein n=1 Tax=Arundo donax TaxID=35708 RepID=A0A0A8ZNI4_ARUDO